MNEDKEMEKEKPSLTKPLGHRNSKRSNRKDYRGLCWFLFSFKYKKKKLEGVYKVDAPRPLERTDVAQRILQRVNIEIQYFDIFLN